VVKKVVRIIKANQQQHHRTTEDEERLDLHQSILPLSSTQQQTFRSSELNVLHTIEKIAMQSRVLIVEGISGSGKDTLQTYLKNKLSNRDVYDYSEGEVLHSWKQLQIAGIAEIRIKFMYHFAHYIRDLISRDENAVFVLNRFHLSTYASTIVDHPELEAQYTEIITVLRTLPVHIFVLELDEAEIDRRSLHPERSTAWQKFQQRIAEKNGFRERLVRQQKLILGAALNQGISYSLLRFDCHQTEQFYLTQALKLRTAVRHNTQSSGVVRKNRRPLSDIVS